MPKYDQIVVNGFFLLAIFLGFIMAAVPREIGIAQYLGVLISLVGTAFIIRSKWKESFSSKWFKLGPPEDGKMKKYYQTGYTLFGSGIFFLFLRF
jgi:hypothetical protein